MRFDDLLADGKTKSTMRIVAVEAAEWFEDLALMFRRDSRPIVAHRHANRSVVAGGADADMHRLGTVTDGVQHQVLQHLNDLDATAGDLGQWIRAHRRVVLAKER